MPIAFWNRVSSVGYYITFAGLLLFLFILFQSARKRERLRPIPWGEGATTLEWTLQLAAAVPPVRDAAAHRRQGRTTKDEARGIR